MHTNEKTFFLNQKMRKEKHCYISQKNVLKTAHLKGRSVNDLVGAPGYHNIGKAGLYIKHFLLLGLRVKKITQAKPNLQRALTFVFDFSNPFSKTQVPLHAFSQQICSFLRILCTGRLILFLYIWKLTLQVTFPPHHHHHSLFGLATRKSTSNPHFPTQQEESKTKILQRNFLNFSVRRVQFNF